MYNKTYFKVSDYLDTLAIGQSNIDNVKRDNTIVFLRISSQTKRVKVTNADYWKYLYCLGFPVFNK